MSVVMARDVVIVECTVDTVLTLQAEPCSDVGHATASTDA